MARFKTYNRRGGDGGIDFDAAEVTVEVLAQTDYLLYVYLFRRLSFEEQAAFQQLSRRVFLKITYQWTLKDFNLRAVQILSTSNVIGQMTSPLSSSQDGKVLT